MINNPHYAYLFLAALEKKGLELEQFDIHVAYIEYCRGQELAGTELLSAAASQGFQQ